MPRRRVSYRRIAIGWRFAHRFARRRIRKAWERPAPWLNVRGE